MTTKTSGGNFNPFMGWYLALILLAVAIIHLFSACSPVKRVLLNDKYYKQVTDKFILDGGCETDTVFTSDTTVLFDTLYALEFQTDTVVIDDVRTVVRTEYKTVTKTVTIRDTAIVPDKAQINLLKSQIVTLNQKLAVIGEKEKQIKELQQNVKDERRRGNKWVFRFWLLIAIALAVIFRKPLWRLASPVKRFLPLLLLVSCYQSPQPLPEQKVNIEKDAFTPPSGFNITPRVNETTVAARRGRDKDGDGIPNSADNCVNTFNPDQSDIDKDGIGDACDTFTDSDGDGVQDGVDNCLRSYNPLQEDCNKNGIGDVCDATPCTVAGNYEHVLFLDFDGHYVNETWWSSTPFYVGASGLTSTEIAQVVDRVRYDFRMFRLTVTTDSTLFHAAPPYKRQRVVITQNNEWYGNAGGVAYIGSMYSSSSGQSAFVFSKLLSYNWFYIAGAVSHEAGHTMGNYHQIGVDYTTCAVTSSYRMGVTMGNPYYNQSYGWVIGESSRKDTTAFCGWRRQDDVAVINRYIPFQ